MSNISFGHQAAAYRIWTRLPTESADGIASKLNNYNEKPAAFVLDGIPKRLLKAANGILKRRAGGVSLPVILHLKNFPNHPA
jgi:hypothetical protein